MDTNTVLLIVVIVLAIVIAFAIWLFRRGDVNAELSGPAGTGAKFKGNQAQPQTSGRPAIKAGNVTAVQGNATLRDETERGIEAQDITAGTDVTIEAKARPDSSDPKEQPPT